MCFNLKTWLEDVLLGPRLEDLGKEVFSSLYSLAYSE